METQVLPLHHNKKYMRQCCSLINDEWKRTETARMHSLDSSCDTLPTSLILLQDNNVIGHLKLSPIPSIKQACFVESVVIQRGLRGKGFGKLLMEKAEDYCRNYLQIASIYLSTHGQEGFYTKLGYSICSPISIYGSFRTTDEIIQECQSKDRGTGKSNAPTPPPLPIFNVNNNNITKTYMKKSLMTSH